MWSLARGANSAQELASTAAAQQDAEQSSSPRAAGHGAVRISRTGTSALIAPLLLHAKAVAIPGHEVHTTLASHIHLARPCQCTKYNLCDLGCDLCAIEAIRMIFASFCKLACVDGV